MRSLDLALKNLEKRLKRHEKPESRFCTEHVPEPKILFTEEEEREFDEQQKAGILDICPICGKPFDPDGPKMPVITFTHHAHEAESEVE